MSTPTPPLNLLPETALALHERYDEAFPILHRALQLTLLQRSFALAADVDVPTESLQFWHKLLIENAKLALPATPDSSAPTRAQLLDLIFDIFSVSPEERERRRALQPGGAR
jgi:hypothetical protein